MINKIQPILYALVILVTFSCVFDKQLQEDLEDLKLEVAALREMLEGNSDIEEVIVADGQLILVFADGSSVTTVLPSASIPSIGENGNWFVDGEDLGAKATAEIPTVGPNGNWWVDGEDTGVSASGSNGINGASAYEIWLASGHSGTETDFLAWLQGAAGLDGQNGTDGQNGSDGTDGQNGSDGSDGQDGSSAYEIWLAAGHSGTENDFLNWLQGNAGTDGIDGVDGNDGNGIASVVYDQTTGVLTITLDDASEYQFTLFYEFELKAVKLEDLNGEYLLSAIYNGDMPFVSFDYNIDNRLTDIRYYTTLLNAPVEYLNINRSYDGSGNITSQTVREYATTDKAVLDDDLYPDQMDGDSLGYEDAFNEIAAEVTLDPNITLAHATALFGNSGAMATPSHIYVNKGLDDIRKYLRRENSSATLGISQTGADINLWTPEYDNEEDTLLSDFPTEYAILASEITFDGGSNWTVGAALDYFYYPVAHSAVATTDPIDITSATTVDDYFATNDADVILENPTSVNGDYKALLGNYTLYSKGDEISSYLISYNYGSFGDGDDFVIDYDNEGTPEDVLRATVSNGKITVIDFFNRDDDVNDWETVLELSYDGFDKLQFISSPMESAPNVVQVSYDGQGNPTEFAVNSSLLADNGNDEIMAFLGLAYSHDVYDPALGRVVEEYVYPDAYTPMINVSYDYTMKNYMNHTIVAANPLMQIFDQGNAIQSVSWAGHGSASITEYLDFNEGGYPTHIKSYIQVSADAIPVGELLNDTDVDVEGLNVPFNVSVATSYRLEYVEKQ